MLRAVAMLLCVVAGGCKLPCVVAGSSTNSAMLLCVVAGGCKDQGSASKGASPQESPSPREPAQSPPRPAASVDECKRVAVHIIELMFPREGSEKLPPELQTSDETRREFAADLAAECLEERWTPDEMKCGLAAKEIETVEKKCGHRLVDELGDPVLE